MTTVRTAEQAGAGPGGASEDVVLVLRNAVAVLDGATSLRPTEHTGGWYATELAAKLRPRLETGGAELAESLATAISETATAHGLRPGSAPSSTVSILRWNESSVDALVLADSPAVVFTDSGAEVVSDDRLAELSVPNGGGYRQRLRAGGGFDELHGQNLREAVDETSRWRNVEGGFWVAEADPLAAYRAVVRSWPRSRVESALLASDGVSGGVEQYESYPDWPALLNHAHEQGPQAVLDRVRAAEESDPDGSRWPRPKKHDDQALVVVDFDRDE